MKIPSLFLFLGCLSLFACQPETVVEKKQESAHKVVSPLVKNTYYNSEYVANIHSVKYVEVRSRVKGYIERSHVDEGQAVKQGQLLFELDSAEFGKELQKANAVYKSKIADVKASEVDVENVKRLLEKNIVAQAELDVALAKLAALKADVEKAQAHKEQAALRLEFTRIKAPYNGIINRIPNKVGSLIEEGDILTSISDTHEVFAYFNMAEADYLDYMDDNKPIKTVQLLLANNALYSEHGVIDSIESEFDKNTGNIAFRARFPNPNGLLKHGSHGKVIIRHELEEALLVPQKSTFEIQDKVYVFLVNQDGTVKQQNIIPKLHLKDFYVVESGLSAQDKIVFEGVETMKEGDKIQVELVNITEEMPENNP